MDSKVMKPKQSMNELTLQKFYKMILDQTRVILIGYTEFDAVAHELIEHGIISCQEYTYICGNPVRCNIAKMGIFLDIFQRKDQLAILYPKFRHVLKKCQCIIALLTLDDRERYQKKKYRVTTVHTK